MGFSMNIAKLLKTPILNKICKPLLLNNAKRNYSSMKTKKQVLNVSQHFWIYAPSLVLVEPSVGSNTNNA